MIDRIESAMTDIDAIIEGLSEAQKAALRDTFDNVLTANPLTGKALQRKGLADFINGNCVRYALTTKGQAVRARLLGDK